MTRPDYARINARLLPQLEALLPGWLPGGHRRGKEWVCASLTGGKRVKGGPCISVNMQTGVWTDFTGSESGGSDPISLYAAIHSLSQSDAAQQLDDMPQPAASARSRPPAVDWIPQPHAPPDTPLPSMRHHELGAPSAHWIYRRANGLVAGIICRYEPEGEAKQIRQMSWCRSGDGREEWRWKAMAEPRPLYGLELLNGLPVVVVEGEKAAEAARRMLPGHSVVTWAGGVNAVEKTDFSPLATYAPLLWPDQDLHVWNERDAEKAAAAGQAVGDVKSEDLQPGTMAMQAIARKIPGARMLIPPPRPVDGWDAADAEAEGFDAPAFVNQAEPDEPPPGQEPGGSPNRLGDMPFRMLGCDKSGYHYLPDSGQTIITLTASQHKSLQLLQLAPLRFWEDAFQCRAGVKWLSAANALMSRSLLLPKFDVRRVRGRGCWLDKDNVVYHAGDRLYVDGKPTDLHGYPTQNIYEAGIAIAYGREKPASNKEAAGLIDLCESLSWDNPLFGKMLAGWLALAPICGALSWRPHIWLTGPSGSGKTWVMANVVAHMVGWAALHVAGNTTEAGIRCTLGSDALPVIFDENESNDQRGQIRVENVLELARQASSESGASIIKGTAAGGSIMFLIRSMFCFASVGVAATKKADVSRVTLLNLKKTDSPEQFARVKELWAKTVNVKGFCQGIRARSIELAAVIRQNAETFSEQAVKFTGDKRSADQLGTLLAGAYSLKNSKIISAAAAAEWLGKQNLDQFKTEKSENDEEMCLNHLLAANIRMDGDNKLAETVSVEQLIYRHVAAADKHAHGTLLRHGIKSKDGGIYVANNHRELESIFKDTAWGHTKWRQQLMRIRNSTMGTQVKFGPFSNQRTVFVPLDIAT